MLYSVCAFGGARLLQQLGLLLQQQLLPPQQTHHQQRRPEVSVTSQCGVSNCFNEDTDRSNRIVVAWDHVIHTAWIAVRVNDANHGDALACLLR